MKEVMGDGGSSLHLIYLKSISHARGGQAFRGRLNEGFYPDLRGLDYCRDVVPQANP